MLRKAEARRAARASEDVEVGAERAEEEQSEEAGISDEEVDEEEFDAEAGWEDAGGSDGEDRLEAYELSDEEEAPNGHVAEVAAVKPKKQHKRTPGQSHTKRAHHKKHKAH